MDQQPAIDQDEDYIRACLQDVQSLMENTLAQTALRFLIADHKELFGNGKMLRSRLAFRVGPASGTAYNTLLHAAAAVELIHMASLLHDDVIDGGHLRRGAPAFWVERGAPGAILLGDLFLFRAVELICHVEDNRLTHPLVSFTGEVCQAESEQELIFRGQTIDWDNCVDIARRKTGSLFAFVAYACGERDEDLCNALKEAGYAVGTAYQLADDVMDALGNPEESDKTLGTDEARDKNTAMSFIEAAHVDPVQRIEALCKFSVDTLADWPEVQQAWRIYLDCDLRPSVQRFLQALTK